MWDNLSLWGISHEKMSGTWDSCPLNVISALPIMTASYKFPTHHFPKNSGVIRSRARILSGGLKGWFTHQLLPLFTHEPHTPSETCVPGPEIFWFQVVAEWEMRVGWLSGWRLMIEKDWCQRGGQNIPKRPFCFLYKLSVTSLVTRSSGSCLFFILVFFQCSARTMVSFFSLPLL